MKYEKLTDDQMRVLRQYSKSAGWLWKSNLLWAWEKGLAPMGYPELYELRNSHGPTWLRDFRFPQE